MDAMAPDSALARPKRSRQDLDDASSPQAAAASTKKRKISGTAQSPPPLTVDAPEPATSARGRGRGRGGRRATSGRGRGRGRGGSSRGGSRVASQEATAQGAAPGGRPDPYELPDSEDERVAARAATAKKPRGSATKPLGSSSRGGRVVGRSIGVVYDLPASGEQPVSPSKVASHASGNGDTPRKALPTGRGVAAASSPAPAPREEDDAGSPGGDMELDPPLLSGSQQALPRQRAKRILEPSVTVARGPTKLSKLKSILTPHKAKGINAARKSVAFDGEDLDQEMSFADVPTTTKKRATPVSVLSSVGNTPGSSGKRGRVSQREEAQAAAAAEEEDDVVCVICSRPESEPPNEILFCDKCDKGFHQQCYNVPVIPEGDWLCRSCVGDATGESVISAASAPRQQQQQHSPSIVVTNSEIPDIANFGEHLRALQRLLLSRCTGTRTIKLRGQDEAYSNALQLVEQTVLAGEGNSMLVIGARGCGKTTVSVTKPSGRFEAP